MFGSFRSPAATYARVGVETSVQTSDPHRLIVMLFEGAISACAQAKIFMADGNIAQKGSSISKAIDIIGNGLKASLDTEQGGELAERLAALYDYMCATLLQANIRNEPALVDEAAGLLSELLDAWKQISPNPPAA